MNEIIKLSDHSKGDFDAQSIVHLINLHGTNLIGLELGVFWGISFMGLLNHCPNIKTLYGVDAWKPYKDYITGNYDENKPVEIIDSKVIEIAKFATYIEIKHSKHKNKAIILEKDSNEALKDIPDNHLDFIFLDAHLTYKQIVNDLKVWYPKVKKGGLYMGHDWHCDVVRKAVYEFREKNNINSTLSTFDETFVWIK